MSLLHPAILSGLGLALIPILLHLLLRAKPKRLIFPALRLIQQNRRQNVRRMQLRHLWLLLLRVFVIGLIVFAMTRPSLPAANYSLNSYEGAVLLLLIAVGIAAYFSVLSWWQRQRWPRHQLLTRRTMLRGGLGTGTALLMLLLVGVPYIRRVSAEIKDPAPKIADNFPVAATFLFDISPSMSYRQDNQSRLQSAQQIARDHLSRLPSASKVAVTGSSERSSPAFSLDLQAARSRIDSQTIKNVGLSLNDCLRTALLAQEEDRRRVTAEQTSVSEELRQDRYLREVYLFTDLTRSAWREESSTLLRDELERLKTVAVYLIDVGEPSPTNVGISSVRLSREMVPSGGSLKIDVLLNSVGAVKPEQTIELLLPSPDGKLIKKGQQTLLVESGIERQVTFDVGGVVGRYQQGELRIIGADPMPIDDVGYFTIQTLPTLRVLIVAEAALYANYWQAAINVMASEKITDFKTDFLPASRLRDADLKPFDVVCLINVTAPEEACWVKLQEYVQAGGGLAVFLGAESSVTTSKSGNDRINPVAYNTQVAQHVLPAELKAKAKHSPAQFMDLRSNGHVLLKRLDDYFALGELGAFDVRSYWKVQPSAESIVVARFGGPGEFPVLVERRLGQGRVILMTTAVDNVAWNDMVGTSWYLVFADQLMQYLSRQAGQRGNYLVGDEVSLPLDGDRQLKKVILRMPDFKQRTQEIPADAKNITIRDLSSVGSYQVDSAESEIDYHRGFSQSLSASETDLRRLEPRDLDTLLGQGRYSVNRDPGSLARNVLAGRLGQEMYSAIVGLLVAVFAMEQFTATWFYRTDEA